MIISLTNLVQYSDIEVQYVLTKKNIKSILKYGQGRNTVIGLNIIFKWGIFKMTKLWHRFFVFEREILV